MPLWPANQIRALVILLVLLAAGVAIGFYRHGRAVESELTITDSSPVQQADRASAPRAPEPPPAMKLQHVVVHVAGAVAKPGVYRLPLDSRNEDAIKAAGGATKQADLDAINLAAIALDGSRLFVPKLVDDAKFESPAASAGPPSAAARRPTRSAKFTEPGRDYLNINTANAEELQRLPGVGPAMSARILQHRKENGPFTDPEQLMDVSGIGEKKLAKMKPYVRIR